MGKETIGRLKASSAWKYFQYLRDVSRPTRRRISKAIFHSLVSSTNANKPDAPAVRHQAPGFRRKADFRFLGVDDPCWSLTGNWTRSGELLIGRGLKTSLTWKGVAQEVVAIVESHSFSGCVNITCGRHTEMRDLYHWASHRLPIQLFCHSSDYPSEASIEITGSNPLAHADQLVLHGAFVRGDAKAYAPAPSTVFLETQTAQVDRWMEDIVKSGRDPALVTAARFRAYLNRWQEATPYFSDSSVILDIGCGNFWPGLFEFHTRRNSDYYGLDIDQRVIDANIIKSQNEPGRFTFVKASNDRLPFSSDMFDFIFSSHSIEHSSDLVSTFSELRRVMRPDAYLFFAVPLNVDRADEHIWIIEPGQWIELTTSAGFAVRNCHIGNTYPESEYDLVVVAQRR